MNGWGGRRTSAGRPRKVEGARKLRTLVAYDDEWDLIKKFAEVVKHGDKEKARHFVLIEN